MVVRSLKWLWPLRIILLGAILVAPLGFAEQNEPVDYDLLAHQIKVKSLRAGNHDAKGLNEYYFSIELFAMVNSQEERALDISERKKLTHPLAETPVVKIENLSIWRPEEGEQAALYVTVAGPTLRQVVSEAMRHFEILERDVSLYIEIKMFEKEKWLMFFGEDQFISSVGYYLVHSAEIERPERENFQLRMSDELGSRVELAIEYKTPITPRGQEAAARP